MGKPLSSNPSKHALVTRRWREKRGEGVKEYQRQYWQRYCQRKSVKKAARERTRRWRDAHQEQTTATKKAWYERTKVLKGRPSGAQHHNWKGADVRYGGIHAWVRRHKGVPHTCEHCERTGDRFHWANVGHTYRRVLSDYIRLCPSCHYKYDVAHGLQPALDGCAGGSASTRSRSSCNSSSD